MVGNIIASEGLIFLTGGDVEFYRAPAGIFPGGLNNAEHFLRPDRRQNVHPVTRMTAITLPARFGGRRQLEADKMIRRPDGQWQWVNGPRLAGD